MSSSKQLFSKPDYEEVSDNDDIESSPPGLHNWLDRVWGLGMTDQKTVILCSMPFSESSQMTDEEIRKKLNVLDFPIVEKIRLPQKAEIFINSNHHIVFEELESEKNSERQYLLSLLNFSTIFCDPPFSTLPFTKAKRPKREIAIRQLTDIFVLLSNGNQFSKKNLAAKNNSLSKISNNSFLGQTDSMTDNNVSSTSQVKSSPSKRPPSTSRMNVTPSKILKTRKNHEIKTVEDENFLTESQNIQSSPPKLGRKKRTVTPKLSRKNKKKDKVSVEFGEVESNDISSDNIDYYSEETDEVEEIQAVEEEDEDDDSIHFKNENKSDVVLLEKLKKPNEKRRRSVMQVEKQQSEDVMQKLKKKRNSITVLSDEKQSMLHKINEKNCLGFFSIPPSRLQDPANYYKIREPDMDFVEILKSSIIANSYADVAPMIVNIEVPDNVVKEFIGKKQEFVKHLQTSQYYWHTLGGNHSRLAYQSLIESDSKYDSKRLVKIYINLTKEEAELIGAEHNKKNLVV